MIPNHFTAKLSSLDLEMVKQIPPGGNWKHIPESIPSKRLEQIRQGFKDGKGSRSTYYGRLSPDQPSYTISTYFNRPGNGCFIHYDAKQHRLISQREAARLQTFPDNFIFSGSKSSINKQIGNAVPPVMAYQIAKSFGKPGLIVDLFTGAGGLSLGFHWAGWKSIVANDIDLNFLQTYQNNIGGETIHGDIKDKKIFKTIVDKVLAAKKKYPKLPIIVIGGPPCQGFSTAGKKRTMKDERNHLFKSYQKILDVIEPDAFVFENVVGILSMEGGTVFELIKKTLKRTTDDLKILKLKTEQYGVPQRRTRIVIIGHKNGFKVEDLQVANKTISSSMALSDLPPLTSSEDGSMGTYTSNPNNYFQKFMRGKVNVEQYLKFVLG